MPQKRSVSNRKPFRHLPGYVAQRPLPVGSGYLVLYDASNATARKRLDSLPDSVGEPGVTRANRWQVVCESHGYVVRTETARQSALDSLKALATYGPALADCCAGCGEAYRLATVAALLASYRVEATEGEGGTSLSISLRHRYSYRIIHSWSPEVTHGLLATEEIDPKRLTLSVLEYACRVGILSPLP